MSLTSLILLINIKLSTDSLKLLAQALTVRHYLEHIDLLNFCYKICFSFHMIMNTKYVTILSTKCHQCIQVLEVPTYQWLYYIYMNLDSVQVKKTQLYTLIDLDNRFEIGWHTLHTFTNISSNNLHHWFEFEQSRLVTPSRSCCVESESLFT